MYNVVGFNIQHQRHCIDVINIVIISVDHK